MNQFRARNSIPTRIMDQQLQHHPNQNQNQHPQQQQNQNQQSPLTQNPFHHQQRQQQQNQNPVQYPASHPHPQQYPTEHPQNPTILPSLKRSRHEYDIDVDDDDDDDAAMMTMTADAHTNTPMKSFKRMRLADSSYSFHSTNAPLLTVNGSSSLSLPPQNPMMNHHSQQQQPLKGLQMTSYGHARPPLSQEEYPPVKKLKGVPHSSSSSGSNNNSNSNSNSNSNPYTQMNSLLGSLHFQRHKGKPPTAPTSTTAHQIIPTQYNNRTTPSQQVIRPKSFPIGSGHGRTLQSMAENDGGVVAVVGQQGLPLAPVVVQQRQQHSQQHSQQPMTNRRAGSSSSKWKTKLQSNSQLY